MNSHGYSRPSVSQEETLSLLDEKSLSDIESDAGRAEIDTKFSTQEWIQAARTALNRLRSLSCRSIILRTGLAFLPSFVQQRFARERIRSDRVASTAYLDGMRGLAALFVFFCHYSYTCFRIAEGWGHGEGNYYILKLPIIRLFYQGPPMVCVFFVVSGYALSFKPLKLMRARSFSAFSTTMTSFIFRRAMRLFLPAAISTFMIAILLQLGAYEGTREFAGDERFMRNVRENHPERLETLSAQLRDWAWNMFNFVHVWSWEKFGGSTGYDVHLWTIPVEFRASAVLFLTLVGMARMRTGIRFALLGLVMWFSYRSSRWEMVLFLAGMGLAELDLIRGAHSSPSSALPVVCEQPPPPPRRSPRIRTAAWTALGVAALYLMSQPDEGFESTPGWATLSSWIPDWFDDKYRYYQCWGAVLFVAAAARLPAWQRLFTLPAVQYLGRVSYAVYLVHGPVLHTAGFALERWAWRVTGTDTDARYVGGFVLASVFVVPLVLWAADVFWRAVDAPVVRFSKWLEQRCSISDQD